MSWENAILKKDPNLWNLKGSLGSFEEKEAHLLLEGKALIEKLKGMNLADQHHSEEVLKTLISGMKWDLKTFRSNDTKQVVYGCKNAQIFDWYCYSIAGCVGAYWVRTFNLPQSIESLAVEYGKGLQRINILRDVVEDWNRGRVYLPSDALERANIKDERPWTAKGWKTFTKDYLTETRRLLRYGANFCDALPYTAYRLRWASMMPLKIGLDTLKVLETRTSFEVVGPKISRSQVKAMARSSLIDVLFGLKLSGRIQVS